MSALTRASLCKLLSLTPSSASSLGMMSEEEKKMQRIEDIKELLS